MVLYRGNLLFLSKLVIAIKEWGDSLKDQHRKKISDILNNTKIRASVILASIIVLSVFVIIANKIITSSNEDTKVMQNHVNNTSKQIRINEYIISNSNTFRDDDWNSPDWIEIYNFGDEPIWLGDVYLSDDLEDPEKYQLPDIAIEPNAYLLILASGKTEIKDNYIRTPFKLGKDDKNILLFSGNQTIDNKEIVYMPTDISAGYGPDGSFGYFAEPTPGFQNNTQLHETYDILPINKYKDLLIINEYLSNNEYNIFDYDREHHDWVELYNPNDYAVFLGDMFLSDDENELDKFKLPDIEIKSNEYIIIYASGKISDAQNEIHTLFKIGANDSSIILSNKNGYLINKCEVFDLPIDVSFGMSDKETGFFRVPTPGKKNDTEPSETLDISAEYISSSPIVINEWMSNNRFGILDATGDASDWLELYNPSDEQISLNGYALSDNENNLFKWEFPIDTIIQPNGYLIVYASRKNTVIEGELHTNFALGDDEKLYLIEPNSSIADGVALEYLPGNVSKGRIEEGYGYFSLPTPGDKNTNAFVPQLKENVSFLLGDVYISEVSSSATHYNKYKRKTVYEYIELYNSSENTIDLSGYTISESNNKSYQFQKISIKPNQYLLIVLKGSTSNSSDVIITTDLSLNSAGERILLKNYEGIIVDCFDTGYLLGDYSSGRISGEENSRVFFKEKTPGSRNVADIYLSYSKKPIFSHSGGMADDKFMLALSCADDATVYYTLNGNIPDEYSSVYKEPILIDKDTVVTAVAISQGKLPSIIESRTFILDRKHDIPIVCLASPPGGLFDLSRGIYANVPGYGIGEYPYFEANYFKDLERPVSFEYYNETGTAGIAFNAGIQIAGGYTRAVSQKSLVIRLRDEYGLSQVEYPFFEDGVTTFKHIFLRNAGQDGWKTKIRDSFIQNSAYLLGTIDMKRGRPAAVYINGEYWGLYNLRDKLNDEYLAIKYDLEQDKINIISEYSSAKKGSNEKWMELRNFCLSTDFRRKENYDALAEQVDVESFMDYIIVQTFFGNVDTHNINFWNAEPDHLKWRPLLFDMDLSIRGVDYNIVDRYFGSSNQVGFHSHIIRALIRNDTFREQFLNRYAYILENIFTEEYLKSEIEMLEDEIRGEMQYHVKRWKRPSSMSYWQLSMDTFKEGTIRRRYEVVEELQSYFDLDDNTVYELFPWYLHK